MCGVCGCGEGETRIEGHAHHHHHQGDDHHHGSEQGRLVALEQDILSRNNEYAAANRRWFSGHDILALNNLELTTLELANWLTTRGSYRAEAQGIGLGEGLRLDEAPVPPNLSGCTLREADLRRRLGVEVLFVRRGERGVQRFPDPDGILGPQDRLVVMGTLSALERLRKGDIPCEGEDRIMDLGEVSGVESAAKDDGRQ